MDHDQITSGAKIDEHRRRPRHCLCCANAPDTDEHVAPEAIGGRLWAPILCSTHNGVANIGADQPLSKNFAPLVTMLQAPRQRGGAGAEFTATDANGDSIIIVAEGFAKQRSLDVKRRDKSGRIAFAEGDLSRLDSLPKNAYSEGGQRHIIAKITIPEARFGVTSDDTITSGLLKMALHFVAGFVTDVNIEDARALLPFISGEKKPTGDMIRTPFLDEDVFPEEWPPRHEITCFRDGESLLLTILLFGAYAYAVRLQLAADLPTGIRYTQTLGENYPKFFDGIARPASLDWNRRPQDSAPDARAWSQPIERRLKRIYEHGAEQAIRARCRRAFELALNESGNFGDLWDRYRAALQLECFSAEDVHVIVTIGRKLHNDGKNAWEIPVALGEAA